MIPLVLLLNTVRFLGLDVSPPGFYVDEAAGAAQVLCIRQTGQDFLLNTLPLFSPGLAGGFYTPAFLYGEALWTRLFGDSAASFRSFMGFVTALTVLFLYLWTRRRAGERVAALAALSASIMPWAFQFSRIAWDPPLATMFLVMALWASDVRGRGAALLPGVLLALSAYSYPPMRVGALVLWILLPGRTWKATLRDLAVFAAVCVPLFVRSMDPDFTARGRVLALWSATPENPYANANAFVIFAGFVKQVLQHLTPSFLFFSGDENLRHSISTVGMLSWLDAAAFVVGAVFLARLVLPEALRARWLGNDERWAWSRSERQVLAVAVTGALIGITPAALTWEGVPHALRAIGAWPFFALFTGVVLARLEQVWRPPAIIGSGSRVPASVVFSIIAVAFFVVYLFHYFTDYAQRAVPWFQNEDEPLARAYPMMVAQGRSCADLRVRDLVPAPVAR